MNQVDTATLVSLTCTASEGCSSFIYALGFCRLHHARYKKYGDETICYKPRGRNHSTKRQEGTVSYIALHHRLFVDRGRADQFMCVDCKDNQAKDWAYDYSGIEEVQGKHVYSLSTDAYHPKCRSCHLKADRKYAREIAA